MARTTEINGVLEIDHARGVVYFHAEDGWTALRICSLPTQIPTPKPGAMLDVTHMVGAGWGTSAITSASDDKELLALRRAAEDCRRHHLDPREDSP